MSFLDKIFGSTPQPELSAEQKILRAVSLLEEKKVAAGLTQLLDRYIGDFGHVVVERRESYSAAPESPFASGKIHSCTSFTCRSRKIDLLLVDARTQWDDPNLHEADLYVVHIGECVLCIGAREKRDMGGSKDWMAHVYALPMTDGLSTNLKIMKAGVWMNDLVEIVSELDSHRAKAKKERVDRQKQSLDDLARDIDLDGN